MSFIVDLGQFVS